MKISWSRKYTLISIYAFIVVACSELFYLAVSQFDVFSAKLGGMIATLQPFIVGFAIAYILNFVLKFVESNVLVGKFFENWKQKSKRFLSMIITYLIAGFILYLFIKIVLPQLIASITGLANDIPMYARETTNWINDILKDLNPTPEVMQFATERWNEFMTKIMEFATDLIPILGLVVKGIFSSIWNVLLGIVVSVYLLISKENFCGLSKKILFSLFSERVSVKVVEIMDRSNETFGKFLSGKILDSFIIGILTFIVLTVVKMPYALLISVIVGVTNIIPFFGPFIGAIPSVIIVLFVSPTKALWLALIIFIIQQIDGNIIGPKILGDSIGISAFWILFSLLVTGKLLGFVGMVIGVPLFAVIYSLIKEVVEYRLEKRGLPTETDDYI
ncbi:MAG: AI-2E family transporter [Clostridioides sp.]|nr:AI-2E family transporter [Clostridioides sp.]